MKRFITKLISFLLIFALIYFLAAEYIYSSHNYLSKQFSFSHVLDRIQRSKQKIDSDTLYIGDSVAEQLFSFYKNKNSLTINGSVLMSGQYILLNNIMKRNDIKHIYLIVSPLSLNQDFSDPRVFNNFIKPFYSIKYISAFDPIIFDKLNTQPFTHLFLLSGFKFLPFSDIRFPNSTEMSSESLSAVNLIYLNKLFALAKSKNIELHFVSTPVPDIYECQFDSLGQNLDSTQRILAQHLIEYKKTIKYLPLSAFRDSLHLSSNSISENLDEYKSWILVQK